MQRKTALHSQHTKCQIFSILSTSPSSSLLPPPSLTSLSHVQVGLVALVGDKERVEVDGGEDDVANNQRVLHMRVGGRGAQQRRHKQLEGAAYRGSGEERKRKDDVKRG